MTCVVKQCKLCNADFVDATRSGNKLFCSVNHKSSFAKAKNAETVKASKARYYKANKNKILNRHLEWSKSKFKAVESGSASSKDINYILRLRVRTRLLKALRITGASKNNSISSLIGCSINQLRQHLESRFVEGMNWSNRSKWHIDHIVPLSSFDLSDPEQLAKACHYTNLQPLWARDNIIKSDRVAQEPA